jgi:hypothetical protein
MIANFFANHGKMKQIDSDNCHRFCWLAYAKRHEELGEGQMTGD